MAGWLARSLGSILYFSPVGGTRTVARERVLLLAIDRSGSPLMIESMGRYKSIVGTRLRARDWLCPKTEAAIGVAVLNRVLAADRPNSVRNAHCTS